MSDSLRYIDLFAGAGGLSEGFIRAGFEPVAHVEADLAACLTLKTRMAYHWLKAHGELEKYDSYLKGETNRRDFYSCVPNELLTTVINAEIGSKSLSAIFDRIDHLLNKNRLHLIVGGPPCQAYSIVGRSRDSQRMLGDKRNYLYTYYAEFLARYKPEYFVFENVTGLLSAKDGEGVRYFDAMRTLFDTHGYKTEYMVLNAQDYGVLQSRKRIILVGTQNGASGFYPMPIKWNPNTTVNEIFKDLPAINAGEGSVGPCEINDYDGTWQIKAGIRTDDTPITWHIARPHNKRDLEIYRYAVELWNKNKERLVYKNLPERLKTHQNENSFSDRFKVVAADLPCSHTVVAHIAKDGHYYIHPDINQNRSISPREAARLQTFPDDYYFEGCSERPSRTAAFKQIGNAVPVLLAQKIAEGLKENW